MSIPAWLKAIEPNRSAETILHAHLRALQSLDTGECPFDHTMPDQGARQAYAVAVHYLHEIQGDYYAELHGLFS